MVTYILPHGRDSMNSSDTGRHQSSFDSSSQDANNNNNTKINNTSSTASVAGTDDVEQVDKARRPRR